METVNIRELQHHLGDMIEKVGRGEEILITRHRKIVGRLVPATSSDESRKIVWPDFGSRARKACGSPKGATLSRIVSEDRDRS